MHQCVYSYTSSLQGLSDVEEANVTMSSTPPPRLVVSSALSITGRPLFLAAMGMVGAQYV